jgi:hypothetical protein
MACPFCHREATTPIAFTWWGGVLGPKLLHHVKCTDCGKGYNGSTQRPNTRAIGVYIGVVLAAAVAIGILFAQR